MKWRKIPRQPRRTKATHTQWRDSIRVIQKTETTTIPSPGMLNELRRQAMESASSDTKRAIRILEENLTKANAANRRLELRWQETDRLYRLEREKTTQLRRKIERRNRTIGELRTKIKAGAS